MSDQNDVIYTRAENGDLLWYRHDGRDDGSFAWASGEGRKVGSGWNGFSNVFSGGDGVIYAIQENGDLLWYRHNGRSDGTFAWASEGKKVSTGWNAFTKVFSGGDGIIYAIEEASRDPRIGHGERIGGHLLWFRHDGWRDGSSVWASGEGRKVGSGWSGFSSVFSDGDGVIYAIQENGDLLWYRHDGRFDGTFAWASDGKKVGTGWNAFSTVFSGGDGVIYAIEEVSRDPRIGHGERIGGHLLWYRHDGRHDGSFVWAPNAGRKVGNSWNVFSSVFSGGDSALTKAAQEIAQFHKDNLALLSVGSPVGSVIPDAAGGFKQLYTFGGILKPQDLPPQLVDRYHVSVEIAAIKCYATDDPGGTDEPYLITTVYALDPSRREDAVDTRRIDNGDGIGDIDTGKVFAFSRQLANNITIPGDGEIRIHVQLWDEEVIGSTKNLKEATSIATKAVVVAGLTYLGGPIGLGVALTSAVTGILDSVGDAIGAAVANIFTDDLVDQHDFVVPTSFLRTLTTGNPAALDRTSGTIPGVTYNFPQGNEDDSWLFERGHGTYRVFLRIINVD